MNGPALQQLHVGVRENAALREYTTFRLGGPCPGLIACTSPEQLVAVVQELARKKLHFLLIGDGSNLLVSDAGLPDWVVRFASDKPQIRRDGNVLEVGAATRLDDLAAYAAREGLEGLGFASGIPGSVGGAVAGNAGAFGRQIGDCIESVLLMNRLSALRWEPASQIGFAYRRSALQQSEEIVVSIRLKARPGNPAPLEKERAEILELRRQKHPDWRVQPTAGSFFKNIEPTSKAGRREAAGWFLDQVGAKTMRVGGAYVFEKHANIIMGGPGCTAQDVMDLSRLMQSAVNQKFGMSLEPEVRIIGPFK